jgi:hypothetical protein
MEAGSEFKIAMSDGQLIDDANWYPTGMGNNYQITASGEYIVYFRPDGQGGDGWHEGYIFAEKQVMDLGPWETWFGDASGQPEMASYLLYDAAAQKAEVHILQNKNGQWKAQVKYHGPSGEDGKCYRVALRMKANHDSGGVTLKWQDDNNTPNVIYENQSINLGADEEYIFDEEVNLGTFDIERLISTDRINYSLEIHQSRSLLKKYPEGRPIFIKGSELLKFRKGL